MTSSATTGIKTVVHPVSDMEQAKAVYTALLGVAPSVDSEYYVGYDVGGQHIGLAPAAARQASTPVVYWEVADIEATLADVTAAGGAVNEPPSEVGGGRVVATVTDPDGNVLGLLHDK